MAPSFDKTKVKSTKMTALSFRQVDSVTRNFRVFRHVVASVMSLGAVVMSIWPTGAMVRAAVTDPPQRRSKEQYDVDLGTPNHGYRTIYGMLVAGWYALTPLEREISA